MYAVFPNWDAQKGDERKFFMRIVERRRQLRSLGYSENQIIHELDSEGLVFAKKGGYIDNCLASGFTRVAANEFNAYLVCEFLLKASLILKQAPILVFDEGRFIKTRSVTFHEGVGEVMSEGGEGSYGRQLVEHCRVLSLVNPRKYDNFPRYRTSVSGYNKLDEPERNEILHDWNWLGFGDNFDHDGDDFEGYDLNQKVFGFRVIESK
jgi:hypothetical protein